MSDIPSPPPAPARKRGCLIPVLIGLLVVIAVALGLWFWFNRPIKPVQLNASEKAAVEAKLETIQQPPASPQSPTYEKGAKEIILTERELNGLLNENTDLGKTLKFELVKGMVHARYETDLEPDLPIVGGRRLKARARFVVNSETGQPQLVLDDLTVWGVSIPNDWLGGLKGQDLLKQTLGTPNGQLPGVEEFQVEDGQLRIKLKE